MAYCWLLDLFKKIPCRAFLNREITQKARKILAIAKFSTQVVRQNSLMPTPLPIACVYMSNHLSLLDVPLIYAVMPGTIRFVAKDDLFHLPFFGRAMYLADIVSIRQKDFYNRLKKMMQEGISLWFFPEGQRSVNGELLAFKAGGFSLARELDVEIVPVAIVGTREALPAGQLKLTRGLLGELRIGEPLNPKIHTLKDVRQSIQGLLG